MENPVFRLEGVIKTKSAMSDFEGPLILILQLLSKDRIEIRDISISLILEQYLEYLDNMAEMDLDIASEFVAMASRLAYIKTKMLLSGGEEISELEQLISSLEELRRGDVYIQIKTVASSFADMYVRGGAMIPGPPEYLPPAKQLSYVHDGSDLSKAMFRMIGRENALLGSLNTRETVYPRRIVYSIPEKISEIQEKLKQSGAILLEELFYESCSRTELIATLIAVLELCRVGVVYLTGGEDGMTISYMGVGRVEYTATSITMYDELQ